MTQLPEQIASLLIPMLGRPLLIPNVAVAEIVNWDTPQKREDSPHWLLGTVQWRGVELPVVSLELMNDAEMDDADHGQRLAVIHGVGEGHLQFFAISVQGLPRLVRVLPGEMSADEPSPDPAFDTLVMVNGERAVIPDLANVERTLSSVF